MRKALSTLPWVEPGSVKGNVETQTATFQIKKGEKFNEDEARRAIEAKTNFKPGKVLEKTEGGKG